MIEHSQIILAQEKMETKIPALHYKCQKNLVFLWSKHNNLL